MKLKLFGKIFEKLLSSRAFSNVLIQHYIHLMHFVNFVNVENVNKIELPFENLLIHTSNFLIIVSGLTRLRNRRYGGHRIKFPSFYPLLVLVVYVVFVRVVVRINFHRCP